MAGKQASDDVTGSAEQDTVATGQLASLKSMFGDRLSAEEWHGVEQALVSQREHATKLRAVPLANGDEPATIFQAVSNHG